MFERRLKWFAGLLSLMALVLIVRLVDIQVVRADEYEELSSRLLTRPVRYLRAPRGSIFDRNGQLLARDEPAWDISVHYAVLTGRGDYLRRVARELRRRGDYPADMPMTEITDTLRREIGQMWTRVAERTGIALTEIVQRRERIQYRVERIREAVQRRSPIVRAVAEENMLHPLVEDVDGETALRIRLDLDKYRWLRYPLLRVVPGSRRFVCEEPAFVHVIGRLGAASRERIEADPLEDQELRRLRPGDRCGIRGVERLGETTLRGTRGRVVEDWDHDVLERIDPERGEDVRLTIDYALQDTIYGYLAEAVGEIVHPTGASAVLLDVETREILALVSYPGYTPQQFDEAYGALRRDTQRRPLRFRAVSDQYPPGSTCKAITLVGALTDGVISEHERIHCTGHLLPNKPNRFRCWIYNRYQTTHDARDNPNGQRGEDAIRNSCNIYFFKVGERLGPERLCRWFSRFGLGRLQGTGLIEESPAIVPDEAWLKRRWGRGHQTADAWNFAIGQGEVTATPLQAANVAASVAAGRWAPVHLAYDADGAALGAEDLEPGEPFDRDALHVLRRGMWRVVNERGGTATRAALDHDEYEMCGKTGSAQTVPQVLNWRFTLEFPDGSRDTVVALSASEALAGYADPKPEIVGRHAADRYPDLLPEEPLPSHAWFIGFTQRKDTPRGGAPRGRVYAVSVIIEFGGSGGRVAGPVAGKIAGLALSREDL